LKGKELIRLFFCLSRHAQSQKTENENPADISAPSRLTSDWEWKKNVYLRFSSWWKWRNSRWRNTDKSMNFIRIYFLFAKQTFVQIRRNTKSDQSIEISNNGNSINSLDYLWVLVDLEHDEINGNLSANTSTPLSPSSHVNFSTNIRVWIRIFCF